MNAPADVYRNFEEGGGGGGSSPLYPGAPSYADANAVLSDLGAQRSLGTRRIMLWEPPGNATTVPGIQGFPTLSTLGTVTAKSPSTSGWKTERRLASLSASTAGSLAAFYSPVTALCPGIYASGALRGGFKWSTTFRVGDPSLVSGARMYCGISYNTAAPTNSSPSDMVQIGIAQLESSGNFHICRGQFTAQNPIDTGVVVSNSDLYTVEIQSLPIPGSTDAAGVSYTVTLRAGPGAPVVFSQSFVGTSSTLPHPADLFALFSACRIWRSNNATAAVVGIDLCRIYCEEYL